jgi:ethanolamine utilization protein EutA
MPDASIQKMNQMEVREPNAESWDKLSLYIKRSPIFPVPYRMHEEYELDLLEGLGEEDEHPMWGTERIELRSVGIDIGSSTSHLMFSHLVLRRMGTKLSSRFVVVNREITWKSDILLTPYIGKYQIDVKRLSDFLDRSYQLAGMDTELIDTGAVIITGEASRKENAEAITALFSKQAGKFVCATAGPNQEAMMAAYGCGAVRETIEGDHHKTLMSVDVGGGTSKIAIVKRGVIQETGATNVGGRLIAIDESGRIARIEEAGELVAKELDIPLYLGKHLEKEEMEALSTLLADILFQIVERKPLSPLAEQLMITPPLNYQGKIDGIMFSGGVGEYIYGVETRDYGDLGRLLGVKIIERAKRSEFGIPVEVSEERIRATVIGASQYTVQVSGNTIFISNEKLLPLKNLKVVFPRLGDIQGGLTSQNVEAAIQQAFARSDLLEGKEVVVLAFHWLFEPRYELLRCLAQGIVSALKKTIQKRIPIILVFNSDVGKLVGNLLQEEFNIHSDIISVDLVHLHDFDYIDIGQVMDKVGVVPVVVKSLVFGKHAEASLREGKLRNN